MVLIDNPAFLLHLAKRPLRIPVDHDKSIR
jgi:hypothetical protein